MNTQINTALETLEAALQTLIESVSSYHPSPAAAQALIRADDELTATLEKLDEHQHAHRRILALREMTNSLDETLTELLTSLDETRRQLVSVPATKFERAPREVPYNDLLSYASRIARFSQPPNPAAFKKLQTQAVEEKLPLGLTAEDAHYLDPSAKTLFTPWPSEEVMKKGALMSLGSQIPIDMLSEAARQRLEEAEKKPAEDTNGTSPEPAQEVEGKKMDYRVASHPKPEAVKIAFDLYTEED